MRNKKQGTGPSVVGSFLISYLMFLVSYFIFKTIYLHKLRL